MGKIMKNGRSYTYTSAPTTTRFVSDPNNENYGWIQYKDENGEWVNYEKAVTSRIVLASPFNNAAGFARLNDSYSAASVTATDTVNINLLAESYGSLAAGFIISDKAYDFTNLEKLVMVHSTTTQRRVDLCANEVATLYITQTKGTSQDASLVYLNKTPSSSGTVEMDISALSGEYYIGFILETNSSNVVTKISEMYLE